YVEQSMTTNGVLLGRLLPRLRDSGLTSVNISIDSLQRARFRDLTGRDELARVVDAIEAAVVAFGEVKINIVMLDGVLGELAAYMDWAARLDGAIICRFIELQTNQPVFYDPGSLESQRVTASELLARLRDIREFQAIDVKGKNPNCRYYRFDESRVR